MEMRLIGIDGGGSKTDAVLCADDGTVLARKIGGPSSPTSLSEAEVKACLSDLLEELLGPYGGLSARVDGIYAGISGGGLARNREFLRGFLQSLMPGIGRQDCGSDSVNAISCVLAHGDGIVAIAGTGTSVFARRQGVMHQVGGWGHLLGDEGSGFDMGRMALRSALRAWDGRGRSTMLTDLCAQRLGMPVQEGIDILYRGGRTLIASFAPCLLQAGEAGDEVAAGLCLEAARALYEAILAASRWLEMPVCPVVMAGSVWQPGGYFERQIGAWLGEGFRLVRAKLPPVYGAAAEAARIAGIVVDADFEQRFAKTILSGGK